MEIIETLEPTTAFLLLGAVSGVVEMIKRLVKGDWRVAIVIAGAAAAGALAALALSINIMIGVVVGFAASGYVTIAQNIGKN